MTEPRRDGQCTELVQRFADTSASGQIGRQSRWGLCTRNAAEGSTLCKQHQAAINRRRRRVAR